MSQQLVSLPEFQKMMATKKAPLENFLGNEKNALRFMSSVMQCVQSNPKLMDCKKESLIGAFMECAAVGLFPSNWSGECFVLPYNSKNGMVAQFQMGYKGFVTLGYRAGVKKVWSEIVYQNDEFEEIKGTQPQIIHKANYEDPGEPIGAYTCAKIGEEIIFMYMPKKRILPMKEFSKAKNSDFSPWNNNDPELWMWKKTVVRQLAKFFPRDEALDRATSLDSMSERGGYVADEGKFVDGNFTNKEIIPVQDQVKTINEVNNEEELNKYKEQFIAIASDYSKEEKEIIMKAIISKRQGFAKAGDTKNVEETKDLPDPDKDKKEIELRELIESKEMLDAGHPDIPKIKARIVNLKKELNK